jgi:hypothetical protein
MEEVEIDQTKVESVIDASQKIKDISDEQVQEAIEKLEQLREQTIRKPRTRKRIKKVKK